MLPKKLRKVCDTEMGSNVVKLKIAVLDKANVKPLQTILLRRVTEGEKLHPVHSQCLHTSDYTN